MDKEELDKRVKAEIDSTLTSLDLKTDTPLTLPAGIVSWLTTPLICPVYGVILIFALSILQFLPTPTKIIYILITFGFNCLLPVIMFVILKQMGVITDIGLNKRTERMIPYIITIVCMVGTAWLFARKGFPFWGVMFFIGGAVAGLVEMIINRWWKISAHSAGVAGLVAMLIRVARVGSPTSDMIWWIIGAILLAGLVGSCRIYLRRHSTMQVLAGMLCGFLCVYLCMLI